VHIPDGFINGTVSAAAGVVSAGGLAVCIKKAKDTLEDKMVPMAGLVAAFIFAVQMLNFPVAAGTSGHLLGGALAAVLVGPWVGGVCMAIVLLVQGLFFADGGLTALGLNWIWAIGAPLYGWVVFAAVRRVLPANKGSVVAASAVAAWLSVVISSMLFVMMYALGGTGTASVGAVFVAMVGVHALVGIGEALITAATVGAVLAVRPDLVYGASDLVPTLEVRAGSPAISVTTEGR
jgi:cobalt/nickel transport system permease protein